MPATIVGKKKAPALAPVLWGASALFLLFLIIKNSALAASLTSSALSLCGKTLIPALFPSAVAARILAESGALSAIAAPLDRISERLFGLDGEVLAVSLTGIICGFPTGAVGAMSLYRQGKICDRQLLRAATLSGTPSLSFLVFAVGERGFGDRNFGFFLFFVSIFSSAAITFLVASWDKRGAKSHKIRAKNSEKCAERQTSGVKSLNLTKNRLGVSELTSAVSSSALDLIRVSAFVIFFSVLAGLAEQALLALRFPPQLASILGVLEITGGMARAASMPSVGKIAASFLSGFGGLCAAAQVASILAGSKIQMGKYLLCRLAAGIVCTAICIPCFL